MIKTISYAILGLVLSASTATADSTTLAQGFNVLVRGDMTLKADVGGRTAVGGNATFQNFAIGSGDNGSNGAALAPDASRYDLVVGGVASLANGSIAKRSAWAGSASATSVGFPTTGASLQTGGTAPVDIACTSDAEALSRELTGFSANGSVNAQWGGEYHNVAFTGDLPYAPVAPEPTPVPEPSVMLLLLGGAGLACAYRFRRPAATWLRRVRS